MKKYLIILSFVASLRNFMAATLTFSALFMNAQVLPSPNAMGTLHGSSQEQLYHGSINEIVPLYEIEAENGFKVPVNLTYSTKGIRVNDIASSVGLGWSLAAGGAVTRVMRGEPDDQSTYTQSLSYQAMMHTHVNKAKGMDYEKDIFYFSFPGGGGRFISLNSNMSSTTKPNTAFYSMPFSDVQIAFTYTSSTSSKWEIKDLQGIRYVFGKSRNAREIITSKSFEEGKEPEANKVWTYISTWYLEEIIFPDLPDASAIKFSYEKNNTRLIDQTTSVSKLFKKVVYDTLFIFKHNGGNDFFKLKSDPNEYPIEPVYSESLIYNYIYHEPGVLSQQVRSDWYNKRLENPLEYSEERVFLWKSQPDEKTEVEGIPSFVGGYSPPHNVRTGGEQVFVSETSTTTTSLRSITFGKGILDFTSSPYRQDVEGMSKLQSITLSPKNGSPVSTTLFTYDYFDYGNISPSCVTTDCRRLKLVSIEKNGFPYRSFNYYNEVSRDFELPHRKSIKTDIYGYYSSEVTGRFAGTNYLDPRLVELLSQPFHNYANRPNININHNIPPCPPPYKCPNTNINRVYINAPDRLPHVTSKANMLWKLNYPTGGYKEFSYEPNPVGGLLIASIVTKDENENFVNGSSYEFSSPVSPRKPRLYSDLGGVSHGGDGRGTITVFSNAPNLVFDFNDLNGFRKAHVKDLKSGTYTEYEFYTPDLSEDRYSIKKTQRVLDDDTNGSWRFEKNMPESEFPYMSYPYIEPQIGLIKAIRNKTHRNGIPHHVKTYHYHEGPSEGSFAQIQVHHSKSNRHHHYYTVGSVKIFCRPLYLSAVTETSKEPGGEIQTRTEYEYHHVFKTLPIASTTIRMKEGEAFNSKSEYRYPFDLKNTSGDAVTRHSIPTLRTMHEKGMNGIPVETIHSLHLPWYSKDEYRISGVNIKRFGTTNNLIKVFSHYSLDAQEPLSDWTYDATRQRNDMQYYANGLLRSEAGTDGIWKSYTYDDNLNLKTVTIDPDISVDGDEHTTVYDHIPLVGIRSVTDPNKRTTRYEYDGRNRLESIWDHNNNLVKRYRYHHAGEELVLNTSIEVGGINATCEMVSFTSNEPESMYGGSSHAWDFGDSVECPSGSGEQRTDGKTVFHKFSAPGEYTIELTMTNPDYDQAKVVTRKITVYDEIAELKIIGPPEVVNCPRTGNGEALVVAIDEQPADNSIPYGHYRFGWGNGATCQKRGYQTAVLKYRFSGGNWVKFSSTASGSLPAEVFRSSGSPYSVEIRGEYMDWCSRETKVATKTITINPCGNSNTGTGPNDVNENIGRATDQND